MSKHINILPKSSVLPSEAKKTRKAMSDILLGTQQLSDTEELFEEETEFADQAIEQDAQSTASDQLNESALSAADLSNSILIDEDDNQKSWDKITSEEDDDDEEEDEEDEHTNNYITESNTAFLSSIEVKEIAFDPQKNIQYLTINEFTRIYNSLIHNINSGSLEVPENETQIDFIIRILKDNLLDIKIIRPKGVDKVVVINLSQLKINENIIRDKLNLMNGL